MSIKLLGKQKLRNDLFKTIASYSQYLVYSDREKAIRFKTINNRLPHLPSGVVVAKREVEDKSLKQYLNFETFCYLDQVMVRMRILNINDITDFRRDQGFTNLFDVHTMRARYKKNISDRTRRVGDYVF